LRISSGIYKNLTLYFNFWTGIGGSSQIIITIIIYFIFIGTAKRINCKKRKTTHDCKVKALRILIINSEELLA
jgi:hypothetical protein